jgi:hypothetical protein
VSKIVVKKRTYRSGRPPSVSVEFESGKVVEAEGSTEATSDPMPLPVDLTRLITVATAYDIAVLKLVTALFNFLPRQRD